MNNKLKFLNRSIALILIILSGFYLFACDGSHGGGSPALLPGTIDSSFGVSGKFTPQDGSFSLGTAILQPDDKIVLGGYWNLNGYSPVPLSRLNNDGSLDTTFGDKGFATTSFGNSTGLHFVSLAIQPDGKIIGAGTAMIPDSTLPGGFNTVNFLERYLPDGNSDTGFTPVVSNSSSTINGVGVQSTAKVLVAETSFIASNKPPVSQLLRFNSDGSLDTTFGSSGFGGVSFPALSYGGLKPLIIQPDDKILVAGFVQGYLTSSCALARYNSDGPADSSFSNGMVVFLPISAYCSIASVAIQPDGKIVVVAVQTPQSLSDPSFLTVARFNSLDGSADSFFGNQGFVSMSVGQTGLGFAPDITVQSNGEILISWSEYMMSASGLNPTASILTRLLPDGNIDANFGLNGMVRSSGPYSNTVNRGVLIQSDDKIISYDTSFDNPIPPASSGPSIFVLTRYWP